ncbi:hypothetical protein R1flu_016108 [Riccia fluitans]|uniref:Uncharacterized protein n=1 Tax=Riccia fluitans TaxID=41844 RepID=A0ABD1YNY5_9MARC
MSYHRKTPLEDSWELSSAPKSVYDSDSSSIGVYMGEEVPEMCSYNLEVYEASEEDLYAYSEEIKALYISGLESVASETEAMEYKGATIYNLKKSTNGGLKKDPLRKGSPNPHGNKG